MWDRKTAKGNGAAHSASRSPSPKPQRVVAVKDSAEMHLDGLRKGKACLGQVSTLRSGACFSAVGRGGDASHHRAVAGESGGVPGSAAVGALMRGHGGGARPERRPERREKDPVAEAKAALHEALQNVPLGHAVDRHPVPTPKYRAEAYRRSSREREQAMPTDHRPTSGYRSEQAPPPRLVDKMNLPSNPVPPKRRELVEAQQKQQQQQQQEQQQRSRLTDQEMRRWEELQERQEAGEPELHQTDSELDLLNQQIMWQLQQQDKITKALFDLDQRKQGKQSPTDVLAVQLAKRLAEREAGKDKKTVEHKDINAVFQSMAMVYDAARDQYRGLEELQQKHMDNLEGLRGEVVLQKKKSEQLWQELDVLRSQYSGVALQSASEMPRSYAA